MNVLKHKSYSILACALIGCLQAFSQDVAPVAVTESGLWTSYSVQKKWDNGISIDFDEEIRLRDNYTTTDKFMHTLDLAYKPFSFLKVGASYTRINFNHAGKKLTLQSVGKLLNNGATEEELQKKYAPYWELRNRYSLYLQGQYSFHRFDVSLKERYQNTYRVGVSQTETRANPKELLRSKLELSYDLKGISLSPYTSCEWLHSINDPSGKNGLVEVRYAAGLKYDFDEGISVECGYLYDKDKDPETPVNTHVITFGLGYSF